MGKETELSREERLAAKLRENLRRRKEQARELSGANPPPSQRPRPPLGASASKTFAEPSPCRA